MESDAASLFSENGGSVHLWLEPQGVGGVGKGRRGGVCDRRACSGIGHRKRSAPLPEWHLDCDRSDPETVSSPVRSEGPEEAPVTSTSTGAGSQGQACGWVAGWVGGGCGKGVEGGEQQGRGEVEEEEEEEGTSAGDILKD